MFGILLAAWLLTQTPIPAAGAPDGLPQFLPDAHDASMSWWDSWSGNNDGLLKYTLAGTSTQRVFELSDDERSTDNPNSKNDPGQDRPQGSLIRDSFHNEEHDVAAPNPELQATSSNNEREDPRQPKGRRYPVDQTSQLERSFESRPEEEEQQGSSDSSESSNESSEEVRPDKPDGKFLLSELNKLEGQPPKRPSSPNFFADRDAKKLGNLLIQLNSGAPDYSYENTEDWSLDYPQCSGREQSPVNLNFDKFLRVGSPLEEVIWTGYWNYPRNLTISNNGHTVELTATWATDQVPFISGGPLEGDYLFSQLHFHWGPDDSVGSEHKFNNQSLPMEMHMVHYKRDYGNAKTAMQYDDGLAVYSFLFEVSDDKSVPINFMEYGLRKIQRSPKQKISILPFPMALFYPPSHDYISYLGSLTTPPCLEIVTWLVSATPLSISQTQLQLFRNIGSTWRVNGNYRPMQELNGRGLWYVSQ